MRQNTEKVTKSITKRKRGGRPKGAKNRTTLLSEAIKNDFTRLARSRSRKIFEKLTEEAINGEPWAVKLFMDKVLPNATDESAQQKGDFGIQIVINDMKAPEIEGKTIEFDEIEAEVIE